MSKVSVFVGVLLVLSSGVLAESVNFTLLTHGDNIGLLPQSKGITGQSGDHLLRTPDDITTSTWNPNGCFSFNFMNPFGVWPPDYPEGYVEGIHSMEGNIALDVDLSGGGSVGIASLYLHGQAKPTVSGDKYAYQYLVESGDPVTDGNYGSIDGLGNTGSYAATADSNWAFNAEIDWYYDTPCVGAVDLTFDDFEWSGFIIPTSELTEAGMNLVTLDDPLGFFGGTSQAFESWLLTEVGPRIPSEAMYVLFVQGQGKATWSNSNMGSWDPEEGLLGETIIAYAIPEPATAVLLLVCMCGGILRCRHSPRWKAGS